MVTLTKDLSIYLYMNSKSLYWYVLCYYDEEFTKFYKIKFNVIKNVLLHNFFIMTRGIIQNPVKHPRWNFLQN